jgi:hypothetical protein
MKQLDYILTNETEALNFLKSRYPLYHLSNVFFRDVQYGIQTMLDGKNMSVGYADAEKIARAFVVHLEKKKTLNPIDQQSWVLNYPEFRKPTVVPAAPAKPAAKPAAPAVAAPGAAKPSLPPLSRLIAGPAKSGALPPLSRPAAGVPTVAKPGGLPPLSRQPAGSATTSKPGGLPPLKSASPTTPAAPPPAAAPAQAEATVSVPPAVDTTKPAAATPTPVPAPKPVAPGEKKPLPPLKSSTPAGKK